MKQRYVTKFGNSNDWWDNLQVVQCLTVRSHRDAIQFVTDHNDSHDLYYGISGKPDEGYLEEIRDDRLIMSSAGPLSTLEQYEVLYVDIDWDLLLYWPSDGPPVRVDLTFDPEAPAIEPRDTPEEAELAKVIQDCLRKSLF